jgi:hypothetical protein
MRPAARLIIDFCRPLDIHYGDCARHPLTLQPCGRLAEAMTRDLEILFFSYSLRTVVDLFEGWIRRMIFVVRFPLGIMFSLPREQFLHIQSISKDS